MGGGGERRGGSLDVGGICISMSVASSTGGGGVVCYLYFREEDGVLMTIDSVKQGPQLFIPLKSFFSRENL